MTRRRKPARDQPLLPPRDTVRPQSDLDREVQAFAAEVRREPLEGQQVLPIDSDDGLTPTEWAEQRLPGSMTGEDDEPWSEDDLALMREHPTDYERTP